jgi:peroxiredoxin
MGRVLLLAGVYNLAWGSACVAFPVATLELLGVAPLPTVPQLWQCIGMIVGVYGLGYLIASRDPFRHWPITLIGLLGKVFGPIGFCIAVSSAQLPMSMGWTILTNDLIWWLPFSGILWGAIRHHQSVGSAYVTPESDAPLLDLRSNHGERLDELADPQPRLVVFLRHAGCTFCREALADIAEQRAQIESTGCGIVLVHMGENDRDEAFFAAYGLDDLPRFSDPECRLYRQFGLDMGGFAELLGPMVWLRGFMAALVNGHGVGPLRGNGFQMPGVYLYHCGQILGGFQHARASDRPDYAALASEFSEPEQIAVAV